jgi:hypothetical protein
MVPGVMIDELHAVVHSAVRVTLRTEFAVRTPAITDYRSDVFDPVTYDGHQSTAVLSGTGTRNLLLDSFNTAKHRLTLNKGVPYDTSTDRSCCRQSRQSC